MWQLLDTATNLARDTGVLEKHGFLVADHRAGPRAREVPHCRTCAHSASAVPLKNTSGGFRRCTVRNRAGGEVQRAAAGATGGT